MWNIFLALIESLEVLKSNVAKMVMIQLETFLCWCQVHIAFIIDVLREISIGDRMADRV